MGLNVRERGDVVSTLRWIEVRLMEMLAAWVPTTPEMEVKLIFGAHLWDAAQAADALGKRTHELRLALQHSVEPVADYVQLLDDLANEPDTARRVAGYYDVVLPSLQAWFDDYVGRVDQLLDAPTLRILDRLGHDIERVIKESVELRAEIPEAALADASWVDGLRQRLAAIGDPVAYRPAREVAAESA